MSLTCSSIGPEVPCRDLATGLFRCTSKANHNLSFRGGRTVKSRTNTLRLTLAALIIGTGLCAQESAWSSGMRFGGGVHTGGMKEALNASQHFGFGYELGYKLAPKGMIVADLGVRWYPGKQIVISTIPRSVPATGVNPTVYEARMRKPEAMGAEGHIKYRYLMSEDMYLQGGLRIAHNRGKETDIGTRLITNGTAISNTGANTAAILAVETIAEKDTEFTTSLGVTAGFGYRLTEMLALETNIFTNQVKLPFSGEKKNAVAFEVSLNVRF